MCLGTEACQCCTGNQVIIKLKLFVAGGKLLEQIIEDHVVIDRLCEAEGFPFLAQGLGQWNFCIGKGKAYRFEIVSPAS